MVCASIYLSTLLFMQLITKICVMTLYILIWCTVHFRDSSYQKHPSCQLSRLSLLPCWLLPGIVNWSESAWTKSTLFTKPSLDISTLSFTSTELLYLIFHYFCQVRIFLLVWYNLNLAVPLLETIFVPHISNDCAIGLLVVIAFSNWLWIRFECWSKKEDTYISSVGGILSEAWAFMFWAWEREIGGENVRVEIYDSTSRIISCHNILLLSSQIINSM